MGTDLVGSCEWGTATLILCADPNQSSGYVTGITRVSVGGMPEHARFPVRPAWQWDAWHAKTPGSRAARHHFIILHGSQRFYGVQRLLVEAGCDFYALVIYMCCLALHWVAQY